jgi:hypothetical protein
MRRITVLIASAVLHASTIPSLAAECTANNNTDALCTRWPTARSQPTSAEDKGKSCRSYAASFYESVMLRHVAASRVDGARVLAALDSVIDAFNDLLATKCGG